LTRLASLELERSVPKVNLDRPKRRGQSGAEFDRVGRSDRVTFRVDRKKR
jgi:hypothetical protein